MRLQIILRRALLATVFTSIASTIPTRAAAEDVTIYRDKMGVPHVYGDTAAAIYYGASYAMAQDRMAEGEMYMRSTLGRLSEILGPDYVEVDREARLRLTTKSDIQAQFKRLKPEYQKILKAMHEGWNTYIHETRNDPAKVPYEYVEWGIQPTEWTLWEFLAVMGGLQRGYGSGGGGHELVNLAFYRDLEKQFGAETAQIIFNDVVPLNDPDAVPIIPDEDRHAALTSSRAPQFAAQSALPVDRIIAAKSAAPDASRALGRTVTSRAPGASRVFMVGASKSVTGNPIMLHATADGPDIHISGAGFNAAGFVLPPMCPIIMGRTQTNAFTFTTGESDLVDIYAEQLNPKNRREYKFNGRWKKMNVREETIIVKGAEKVIFEIETTIHGPVVARDDGAYVAYSEKNAVAGSELAGLSAMIELNRAHDLKSYKKAAEAMPYNFNVNYAGIDGHIALFHSGSLPIRPETIDPRLPTPGNGEYEWRGFLDPEDHPFVVDPKQGFIHAWNNKVTSDSHYGDTSRYGRSGRTWLGVKLGNEMDKVTREDVQDFHRQMGRSAGAADLTVTNPKLFTPYLKKAVAGDKELEKVVDTMHDWNGIYEDLNEDGYYDNAGLTIYREWIDIAQKKIIGDDIGEWWRKIDEQNYIKYRTDVVLRAIEGDDAGAPMKYDWFNGEDPNAVLKETIRQAAQSLAERYGSADPDKWRHHVFYRYYNANAAKDNPDKPSFNAPHNSTAGRLGLQPAYVAANLSESWNMLVELKPEDTHLYDSTPTGGQNMFIDQHGKGNPNIADQVMLHANFEFKAVAIEKDAVVKDAVSKQIVALPDSLGESR